ncbi:hypothetical protein IFR05_008235 [Cadophora sp. M221]|nr:hypothetical protein IFR05_008235 [Cadophora sp. M221]
MNDIKIKYQQSSDNNDSSIGMLFDILKYRRGLGVTDPRDMIYGHLGLCDSTVRSSLSIDYSLSVSQIYQETALEILGFTKNLSILLHVEHIQPEDRRSDLPSWAPDWTVPFTPPASLEALGPSPAKWNIGITVAKSNALLTVIGCQRGTIAILAPNGIFPGLGPSMTPADVLEYFVSPLYSSSSFPILTNFIKMCSSNALHAAYQARERLVESLKKNWGTSSPEPRTVASITHLICTTFASSPDSHQIFKDLDPQSGLALYIASRLYRRICKIGDLSSTGENVAITSTDFVTCVPDMAREGDILCDLDGCYDINDHATDTFVIVRPRVGHDLETKMESSEPGSMPLNLTSEQADWVVGGMEVIYCRFVTCQLYQSQYSAPMIRSNETGDYKRGGYGIFTIY